MVVQNVRAAPQGPGQTPAVQVQQRGVRPASCGEGREDGMSVLLSRTLRLGGKQEEVTHIDVVSNGYGGRTRAHVFGINYWLGRYDG